ncbi:MAG: hypothetical protein AB7J13_05565 [Pyrinomonadaceae bacterium]
MTRAKTFIAIAAFSIMVLCLPAIASAQWRNDDDYNRGRGNNSGNYGNGQYGNGQYGNSGSMRAVLRNLKNNTRNFQRQLDRDLDRSRLNGTRREDQINEIASRFRDAVNDLDDDGYFNNGRYNDRRNRGDNEMRRVYDLAAQIERSIGRANISYQTRNLWSAVRNDLQTVSRGYGYNNGRNGPWNNGRNNRNTRNGLPSWWPF